MVEESESNRGSGGWIDEVAAPMRQAGHPLVRAAVDRSGFVFVWRRRGFQETEER